MCDFLQAWPSTITKAFPARHHGVNCPPSQTRLDAQPVHCGLWRELQSRTQTPLASHAHGTLAFLVPAPSPIGFCIWSGQRPPSGASAEVFLPEEKRETLKTLFPTLTQSTPSPSPSPPSNLGVQKSARTFSSGLPQQWDDPHVYADPPYPPRCATPR